MSIVLIQINYSQRLVLVGYGVDSFCREEEDQSEQTDV